MSVNEEAQRIARKKSVYDIIQYLVVLHFLPGDALYWVAEVSMLTSWFFKNKFVRSNQIYNRFNDIVKLVSYQTVFQ